MAIATQPNVALTSAWSLITDSVPQLTLQLLSYGEAIVFIGSAQPDANSIDGHRVLNETGRDTVTISGMTTEKVYGRALKSEALLAVTKG